MQPPTPKGSQPDPIYHPGPRIALPWEISDEEASAIMSLRLESHTLRPLLLSTVGLGLACVILDQVLGDWVFFRELLDELLNKPAKSDLSPIVNIIRIFDAVLLLVAIACQWFVGRKLADQTSFSRSVSFAAVFLIFLAILLIKHIGIVSYPIIQPEHWHPRF